MLSFVERTQSHDRSAQSLLAPPPPNLPHSDQQTIPKLAIAVEQPVGALCIRPATEWHNKHHQTPVQPTGESQCVSATLASPLCEVWYPIRSAALH